MVELFCGIGGARVAASGMYQPTHAFDQNDSALSVYRLNAQDHEAKVSSKNIEQLAHSDFRALPPASAGALWWLSPPCQPYTVQGVRKDLDDPRAKSFRHLLENLSVNPPHDIALENVVGFKFSRARLLLLKTLREQGYQYDERVICPTELGFPSRRPRYYLAASRSHQPRIDPGPAQPRSLESFLLPPTLVSEDLWLAPAAVDKYRRTLPMIATDRVGDPDVHTLCFTSGYGRAFSRSGSYLWDPSSDRVRRFSPLEVANLLGFPKSFRFPPVTTNVQKWRLVGNSLSVPAVKRVLLSLSDPKIWG
jgi:DNA (cytosine-5)-methyltransferase 1